MRKFFVAIVITIGLAIVVPLLGPSLELAEYRQSTPAAGESVKLTGSRTLNVYRGGSGPTVVLVHGRPGFGVLMQPLAKEMEKLGFSWLAYDRLGWGYSSPRPLAVNANPTNNALDLLALLKTEDIDKAFLVGTSYGGGVVLEALRINPDNASCAGLISSIGDNALSRESSILAKIVGSAPVLTWAFSTSFTARYFAGGSFLRLFEPERPPSQRWVDGFMGSTALPGVTKTWEREGTEFYTEFSGFKLNSVLTPTIIIHGSDDTVVSLTAARHLEDTLPNSKLKIEDKGGHGIVVTRPTKLATLLADWYQSDCQAIL